MTAVKQLMRDRLPRVYSQDLLNNLFRHPYTRIEFVVSDLGVSRQTAAKYLDALASVGIVEKHQAGRSNYYINVKLVHLLYDLSN
jgi:Fic family protein